MYRRNGSNIQQKGAITVFLALIFMSLIIFAGAVIDIVRIAAADRKVQSVLNTAARSILAGYDSELVGEYGVYGINTSTDAVKDDFYRYISVNLEERHEGINFIDITVESEDVAIQGTDNLLEDDIFQKQIQEYMKYKAPITIGESLVEQLKNIKLDKKIDFEKGEKVTRDKARELRTKANEVNAKLAGIKNKIGELSAEKLEDLSKDLAETLTISGSIFNDSGNSLLENYNNSKEDSNIKAKAGECIENQSEEFINIEENSKSLIPELRRSREEVDRTLVIIRPLLRQLKDRQNELSCLEEELSDLKEDLSDLKESKDSSSESIARIREEITEVKEEIDDIRSVIEQIEFRIQEEIARLKATIGGFSLEGYSLREEAIELADKKSEQLKNSINQIKERITNSLLRRVEKDWLINSDEFNSSSLIFGEDFDVMDDKTSYRASMQEAEAEKSNDTIIEGMEKLAKAIEGAAASTSEKINMIEYIMDKYTFLTSKTDRNHYFKKGEVEYIICGADTGEAYSTSKNTEYYVVTNVLLQVWALRFAIDTIDDFIMSSIVFPPQRLAFALAEGALDSCMDMFNMLNGEGVSICPKSFTAVKLKYSDHLKILLLLEPEEEILRKARQLMQVNIKHAVDIKTGSQRANFRMGNYSTVISASVEAKVNLFFLPLLKVDRFIPGSFEGGRYIIRKQIHAGY